MKKILSLLAISAFSMALCSAVELKVVKAKRLKPTEQVFVEVKMNNASLTRETDLNWFMKILVPGDFQPITKNEPALLNIKDPRHKIVKITAKMYHNQKAFYKTRIIKNIKGDIKVIITRNKHNKPKMIINGRYEKIRMCKNKPCPKRKNKMKRGKRNAKKCVKKRYPKRKKFKKKGKSCNCFWDCVCEENVNTPWEGNIDEDQ